MHHDLPLSERDGYLSTPRAPSSDSARPDTARSAPS
jgi:hypothetical protein